MIVQSTQNPPSNLIDSTGMNKAPIALFVYNRPWHTQQTIEALQKNELAEKSDLFIFSDAPKKSEAAAAVQEVRNYIKTIGGFKIVNIVERTENLGLANSIIDGVTRLCNKYGRVIVLEDDLVASPYFLGYMNTALDIYESDNSVMHVAGYMFPIRNPEKLPETFFYRASSCWGWATWKRAWNSFESDSTYLLENICARKLGYEFDIHGTGGFTAMLKNQADGLLDSWAIRWYASIFLKNGLCLHPAISLVNNIGHDGSGVHCGSSAAYAADVLNAKPIKIDKLQEIKESPEGLAAIEEFNLSLRQPFYIRVYSGLIRRIRKIIGMAGQDDKDSK